MLINMILFNHVPTVTALGIPKYGYLVVFGLILLLVFKNILSTPETQRKTVSSSLNLVIGPLLIVFIATVIYKVMEIL